ncbi:MAG: TlpA family protein disulfide reductase [Tannerella sp.]|jgi:peroxiredoxin|nr:TlpA family protein disulfide reductase [Tannerella sp.]
MNVNNYSFLLAGLALFSACSSSPKDARTLQNGVWRGELALIDNKQAPVLVEVTKAGSAAETLTLINGEERVPLTNIRYDADTVIIPVESYDAVIRATVSGKHLEGRFLKNYIENDSGVPLKAERRNTVRFKSTEIPATIPVDGKWDVFYIREKGDTTHNVGIFKSQKARVTGSILTNSGDLRFLDGILTGNGFKLSAFSGLSPYLIEAEFIGNDTFEGTFYTTRGKTKLVGCRNDQAALEDAYSLTSMKEGFDQLHFELPDLDGNPVSLSDERYKDKVVVVSVLGSWCPNCLDEAQYLSPWYKTNKDRGVEIVGLAFERKDDFAAAQTALNRLKKKYKIDYEILFAGQVGKSIETALPELENFSSYPTTIFIDKKGIVRKIHTGFSGPATGVFYEEFQQEFNDLINTLLSE